MTIPPEQVELLQWPSLVAAAIVLFAAILLWFLSINRTMKTEQDLENGWRDLISAEALLDFVPFTIWWLLLTWVAYSVAGEKMPWLSAHFVPPMVLLVGWYFNERITPPCAKKLFTRPALLLTGLTGVGIVAAALAFRFILFGEVQLGDQATANLTRLGQFLGNSLVVAGLVWLVVRVRIEIAPLSANSPGSSLFSYCSACSPCTAAIRPTTPTPTTPTNSLSTLTAHPPLKPSS